MKVELLFFLFLLNIIIKLLFKVPISSKEVFIDSDLEQQQREWELRTCLLHSLKNSVNTAYMPQKENFFVLRNNLTLKCKF